MGPRLDILLLFSLQKILSPIVVRCAQRALSPAHVNKKRYIATLLVMLFTRFPTNNEKLLVPTTTALYATKNVAIWRFLLTRAGDKAR